MHKPGQRNPLEKATLLWNNYSCPCYSKAMPTPRAARSAGNASRFRDVVAIAEHRGLLAGGRTLMVRGRMPVGLVAEAKRRSGITSDSKLVEAALANIAVEDEYWDWMASQRGTVRADLDLEF